MRFVDTAIADVKIVEPKVLGDERGFFVETWRTDWFDPAVAFVQDNHSRSAAGVLRGLHYQLRQPQGKLIRVVAGAIFDVAVDVRRSSATFGRSVTVELSADNHRMVWVPAGFAHGFLTLSEGTEVLYKCTDYFAPEWERAIAWDDPALAIAWPLQPGWMPALSAKDAGAPALADAECPP